MSDIKKLRELLNLTQKEFADKLNTTERTIQNWERGSKIPKPKLKLLSQMASQFPDATFATFEALDSPNAGYGNGISSADLKRILDEIDSQRKDYMAEIAKRDKEIEELISIIKAKL